MRAQKLVLAVGGSSCGDAAADAMIAQFQLSLVEVRVIHVVEWSQVLAAPLGFAEGAV